MKESINIISELLGKIIISILIMAIPILMTCAFIFGWFGIIQFILFMLTFMEWTCVVFALTD